MLTLPLRKNYKSELSPLDTTAVGFATIALNSILSTFKGRRTGRDVRPDCPERKGDDTAMQVIVICIVYSLGGITIIYGLTWNLPDLVVS